MSQANECPHLIRAPAVKAAESTASHPWNPKSLLQGTHLSSLAGLKRTGVSLVRLDGEVVVYDLESGAPLGPLQQED